MELTIDYNTLLSMKTISSGWSADLKIDTGEIRVWLSRMTLEDGEAEPIQIEILVDGSWIPHHGDILLSSAKNNYRVKWIGRGRNYEYDCRSHLWEIDD